MLFQFELRSLESIVPREGDGEPGQNWNGLTEGWFWMNCGGQELFRYTDETLQALQAKGTRVTDKPYAHHLVFDPWQNLLQLLPLIQIPMPQSLIQIIKSDFDADKWRLQIARFFLDQDKIIPPATEAQLNVATHWWQSLKLNVDPLENAPRVWFWADGDTMFIRWDNSELSLNGQPIWTATRGTSTMPLQAFIEEVQSFDRRLINAMADRVQTIEQSRSGAKLHIDIKALVKEQRERAAWLASSSKMLRNMGPNSFDETVAAIGYFERLGFAPSVVG